MGYALLIGPGRKIKLKDYPPDHSSDLSHEEVNSQLEPMLKELNDLQEILYAARKNSVLIILQGMDTSGKDGVIRHVVGSLNAQGCRVVSFKVPTELEQSHDFLWRVHKEVPALGDLTVFNRSHYEDVLVPRVHKQISDKVWRSRYQHINNFESLLTDANTIIFKFFLHISKAEQEKRLLAREQEREKYWKLSVRDWQERENWEDYQDAYEGAINNCSTPYAPWYIVPADKKWYRNLAITETIVNTLRPYRKGWLKSLDEVGKRELAAIKEHRAK